MMPFVEPPSDPSRPHPARPCADPQHGHEGTAPTDPAAAGATSQPTADQTPGMAPGDRVELIFTDDPYTNLRPGDRGTVTHIRTDLFGPMIIIQWDSGSTLSMRPDAGDQISRVTD